MAFMTSLSEKLGVEPQNVRLLNTIYFTFFASGMISTLLGAILPNLKSAYNISYILTGSVYSFHQLGNLIAVILAGILPYIIGRKKTTIIMFSGLVIGILIITFTGTPVMLLLAFTLTGIGRGTASNITNVVVASTTKNKTAGLNILHASFAVGALFSPFILIFLSSFSPISGWRFTMWFVAACMITVLILITSSSMSNEKEGKLKQTGFSSAVTPFYRSLSYWLNTAILTFYLCGESANMGWLVTYFKDTGLMGQTFAQITSSLMWIMILCGRLMCASISGKVNRNKLVLILAALNTAFFILMISTRCMPVIIIGLLGTGFSMSGIYPTTLSTMKPEYNTSTIAVGTCMGIALTGATVMPLIVGTIAEKVTATAVQSGLSQTAAENRGVSSGMGAIAFALAVMLILNIVKYLLSRKNH